MANAALISYPRFEDLQKSNIITFAEPTSNLKKSRRPHRERNEYLVDDNYSKSATNKEINSNCIEYNATPDNDISRSNAVKVKKKEMQILPTLDERDEKTETSDQSFKDEKNIQNASEFPKIETSGDTAKEKVKLKSKFSNHTLVTNNRLKNPTTLKHSIYNTVNEEPPNLTTTFPNETKEVEDESLNNLNLNYNTSSCSIKYEGDSSSPVNAYKEIPNSCETQIVKYVQNMPTLMPNTFEFQELDLMKKIEKPTYPPMLEFNQSLQPQSKTIARKESNFSQCHEKEIKFKTDSPKSRFQALRLVLVTLWAITFTGILIHMALNDDASEMMVTEEVKPIKHEHRNYEICLLIGRNFRRLIVSLIK